MARRIDTSVVEGPLGLKMPAETARRIEEASKDLPKDFTYRRKGGPGGEFSFGLEDGSRTEVSTITTDAIDRDNEVVLPGGIDTSDYKRNPVVFYAHDYSELPLGKALWVKPVDNGLVAKTKYAKKPDGWSGPWIPDAVMSMMQEDMCIGKSIGFLPMSMRGPTKDEISQRPELKSVGAIIDKSLMLEFSVAPLPANGAALMQAVSKCLKAGVIDKRIAEFLTDSAEVPTVVSPAPNCYKCNTAMLETKSELGKCYACEKCGVKYSEKSVETAIVIEAKDANDNMDLDSTAMPDCPKCMKPDGVTKKSDEGEYTCSMCNSDFMHLPDGGIASAATCAADDPYAKSVKSLEVNGVCVKRARVLIAEGKVNHGEWSAPVGSERNADDCLAVDTGASDAAKYKYPIIKGGELYSEGVGAAAARAEDNGAANVAATAHEIAKQIETHAERKYLSQPSMTPDSKANSIRLEAARQKRLAEETTQQAIEDAITLAKGG